MEDGKDCAITLWIQEFVGVPTGGERAGLGFAIAYNTADEQIRIIKRGAIGVEQRISKFPTLVNRSRSIGRGMAGNSTRPGELREQALHALFILRDRRIEFGIGAFQVSVGDNPRTSMSGAGNVDGIQVVGVDEPVHVDVNEIESRRCSPVSKQARLNVLDFQRLAQER